MDGKINRINEEVEVEEEEQKKLWRRREIKIVKEEERLILWRGREFKNEEGK